MSAPRPRGPREAKALAALERDLRRRGYSPRTYEGVAWAAALLLRDANKPVGRVTREDVRRFLAGRAVSVAASTQHGDLARLRTFYRSMLAAGLVAHDATERLDVKRPGHQPQLVLSETDVQRLLVVAAQNVDHTNDRQRARALRDRALVELLYGLGLRQSELRAAQLTDLDLSGQQLLVRTAKRGERRTLPLPEASVPWLGSWLREGRPALMRAPDDGALLVSARLGHRLGTGSVWWIISKLASRAGLDANPHALRRGLATGLVRAGVPVPVVQAVLGHKQLRTTTRYVAVERGDLRQAVEGLDAARTGTR